MMIEQSTALVTGLGIIVAVLALGFLAVIVIGKAKEQEYRHTKV